MDTPDEEIDGGYDDESVNSFLTEPDDSDDDAGIESFESELYGPLENDDEGEDEPAPW